MSGGARTEWVSENALRIVLADAPSDAASERVASVARVLREDRPEHIVEVIPAYTCVTVVFDASALIDESRAQHVVHALIERAEAQGWDSLWVGDHVAFKRRLTMSKLVKPLRDLFKDEVRVLGKELGLPKRDTDAMPAADLELALLRHWAIEHTWADPKRVASMNAGELRQTLDDHGRFLLHRIGWVQTIEALGGLHVIGTERHESRRIDNQLRGRAGRQGDPGSSRFYLSLDDPLMRIFAGDRVRAIMDRLKMPEGEAIEARMVTPGLPSASTKVSSSACSPNIWTCLMVTMPARVMPRTRLFTLISSSLSMASFS